jgi:hypothetical protein
MFTSIQKNNTVSYLIIILVINIGEIVLNMNRLKTIATSTTTPLEIPSYDDPSSKDKVLLYIQFSEIVMVPSLLRSLLVGTEVIH